MRKRSKEPAAPKSSEKASVSRIPQESDPSLVVLDNPDDGELYDTGDASDFAGEKERKQRPDTEGHEIRSLSRKPSRGLEKRS